jgi:perosamine synthetase
LGKIPGAELGLEMNSTKKRGKMISHSKPFVDNIDVLATAMQVESQLHATGDIVEEFENSISKLIGSKYAKATSSGSTALHLALLSLNVNQKDEVIIPSYVCQALLNVVRHTRAKPILADIDANYHISEKTIIPLITKKTKAIIVPHLFGSTANIENILKLKIPVIEDCAQSIGTMYEGEPVGSKGKIGTFSFFATKTISTGFGGMIVTNSKEIKSKIDNLTKYDKRESYDIAYNYNLTDIQAALGLSQLEKLPVFIERRKQIAQKYDEAFKSLNIKLPLNTDGSYPFRYVIQLQDENQRDSLQEKLKEKGIISERPIYRPLHRYLSLPNDKFPNTEKAHATSLSIPIYPALKDEEIKHIINALKNIL